MQSKKLVLSVLTALAAGNCWGGIAGASDTQAAELTMKMPETAEEKNHNPSVKLKISGYVKQSIEHHYNKGDAGASNWWAKEIYLTPEIEFPKSEGDWKFKAQFVTKFGSDDRYALNDERLMEDQLYNGNMARDEMLRPEQYYFEGNLGKTGQYAKIGTFQPWVQMGYVFSGNMLGLSLEHWGNGYATHVFGGVLDVANGDLAVGAQPTYDNTAGAWMPTIRQIWSDNTRAHKSYQIVTTEDSPGVWNQHLSYDGVSAMDADEEKRLLENGGTGSDNALKNLNDPWKPGTNTTKRIFGAAYDKKLSPRLDGSIGYYYYKSAAYNREPLHIGALTLNYKLRDGLNLQTIYAQGNQHGENSNPRGFMVDLMYGGNPWLPVGKAGALGAYIGYHYLAPDSYVKCAYGDDIDKGQKGIAMGAFYNITKSIQLSVKYGNGHSLTTGAHRQKFYASLAAYF